MSNGYDFRTGQAVHPTRGDATTGSGGSSDQSRSTEEGGKESDDSAGEGGKRMRAAV